MPIVHSDATDAPITERQSLKGAVPVSASTLGLNCVECDKPIGRPRTVPLCSTQCRDKNEERRAWERERDRQLLRRRLDRPVAITVTTATGRRERTVQGGARSAGEVVAALYEVLGETADGQWESVTIEPTKECKCGCKTPVPLHAGLYAGSGKDRHRPVYPDR